MSTECLVLDFDMGWDFDSAFNKCKVFPLDSKKSKHYDLKIQEM